MRVKFLTGGVALAAFLLCSPADARTVTQGPDLSAAADGGFGCETAFLAGPESPYEYQPYASGYSTCTTWMAGGPVQTSGLTPLSGTVTKVRIKSGPSPAPLQITILRKLFQSSKSKPNQIDSVCCTGVSESAVFTPTPNAVTEVPVNLAVSMQPALDGDTGYHDIVAVAGAGPGQLPIASVGPHNLFVNGSDTPFTEFFYPKIAPGTASHNNHDYPNYMLLMQYDVCDGGASAARARASQACGAGTGAGAPFLQTNAKGKPVASIASKRLKMRKGKVAVRVRCATGTKARCKGKVGLYTRPKKGKAKLLARRSVKVRDGKSAKVTLKLSRTARKRVKKKSNKVQVRFYLGKKLGTVSRNATLRR